MMFGALLLLTLGLAQAAVDARGYSSLVKNNPLVDVPRMWSELNAHCDAGRCSLHTGSERKLEALTNTTDCKGRMLAYEYALKRIPARAPQRDVFDALELFTTCGVTPPSDAPAAPVAVLLPTHATVETTFYVSSSTGNDAQPGTKDKPFKTVDRALSATRSSSVSRGTIVLTAGTHYLDKTVELGAGDSGLTIAASPDAAGKVWLSGGKALSADGVKWSQWAGRPDPSMNIWKATVDVPAFKGLNTLKGGSEGRRGGTYARMTRARYPDGNFEDCSGNHFPRGLHCWNHGMKHWHKDLSCVGKAKTVYKDLRFCDEHGKLPGGAPCKNNSAMWNTYNTYSSGHGGCCEAWSGDDSPHG